MSGCRARILGAVESTMNRGKTTNKFPGTKNSILYMDLEEIVRDNALKFLPAKSLLRCSIVCRDWKLQIHSPFFAHNQSISFRATLGFFVQSPSGVPSFISLDPMACGIPDPSLSFLPEPVIIRSSSNGLVCCQGRTEYKAYYICNPVTKQWNKLPKPEADHGRDPAVVLVFEPSLLNFTANYKLVCAFQSELDGYEFEIYSSEKGEWSISPEIIFGDRKLLPGSGLHLEGTVYWQASYGLTAFDVKVERSQQLPSTTGKLGAWNGKLCSASMQGSKLSISVLSNTHTNTMQMGSYARPWVNVASKVLPDIPVDSSCSSYAYEYDWKSRNHGVIFVDGNVVLIRSVNKLYSYDLKKKTTTCLGEVDVNATIIGYVNSLVEL